MFSRITYSMIIIKRPGLTKENVMKTLIFNGSPRIHGDTVRLIEKITEKIAGDYRIINTYRNVIIF